MALINNIWVQVVDEDWEKDVDSTSHPVEQGIPLTDTIRNKPIVLSLSGHIVNVGTKKAKTIISELEKLKKEGSLITYKGVQTMSNLQIQTFKCGHSNSTWGGCKFEMELKEVRIAKKAYVAPKTQTTKKSTELKEGSRVVFKGGNVYVSSDAKKPAAKRSRSTCTLTKISKHSWSIHPYHLISTDGGRVYGWVDVKDVEGASGKVTKTQPKKSGGTQQKTTPPANTDKPTEHTPDPKYGTPVYHTVRWNDSLRSIADAYEDLAHPTLITWTKAASSVFEWIQMANTKTVHVTRGSDGSKHWSVDVGARLLVGYQRGSASGPQSNRTNMLK